MVATVNANWRHLLIDIPPETCYSVRIWEAHTQLTEKLMDTNSVMEKLVNGLLEVLTDYKSGLVSNTEAAGKIAVLSAMACDLMMNDRSPESKIAILSSLN